MSEMVAARTMRGAGGAGLLVSLIATAIIGLILILASVGSGLGASAGDGGGGDDTVSTIVQGLLLAAMGIGLCAATIRVSVGHAARGRKLLVLVAGGALFLGTIALLAGSVVVGQWITDGAGILWTPAGMVASTVYLYLWALVTARRLSADPR